MDTRNRFHTPETWLWVRAEYLVLLAALVVLVVLHLDEVNWPRFVAAFVLIDLIGYLPGAVAYVQLRRTVQRWRTEPPRLKPPEGAPTPTADPSASYTL